MTYYTITVVCKGNPYWYSWINFCHIKK